MNTIKTDASRLAELMKSVKNKSEFAREFNIPGGSSMIYQHTQGLRPISLEAALAYARGFGCSIEDISPELARKLPNKGGLPSTEKELEDKKEVAIFKALEVNASCGSGYINDDYPEIISTLEIATEKSYELIGSINRSGHIVILTATGDSMIPTIQAGDQLFVDTSVIDFRGQGIYILRHGDELLCKRLSLTGKDIIVSSDNKFYPPWNWSDKPDETVIIGKVLRALPIELKIF